MDALYLSHAVDNLLAGLLLIKDSTGEKFIAAAQKNRLPLPTRYPFVVVYQGGGALSESAAGINFVNQTWVVTVRYILGKVTDGYHGRLQEMLWEHQLLIPNHVNTHPALVYPGDGDTVVGDFIPELHPDGVFCNQATRLGVFRDDAVHLGVEFAVTMPFIVQIMKNFTGVNYG